MKADFYVLANLIWLNVHPPLETFIFSKKRDHLQGFIRQHRRNQTYYIQAHHSVIHLKLDLVDALYKVRG